MMSRAINLISFAVFFLILFSTWGRAEVRAIDWSAVKTFDIVLFYPGMVSWEFLTGDDHRLGGRAIKRTRKDCRHCHLSKDNVLDLKVDGITSGSIRMKRSHDFYEPDPIPGKKPTLRATVQAAYDKDYLYLRLTWPSAGRSWKAGSNDPAPDRVSVQLNAAEPNFEKYGCFISCHNDVEGMSGKPTAKEVRANRYYGSLGREDVHLYAFYARDGWQSPKGPKELVDIVKKGGLIDVIALDLYEGMAAPRDGWILDDRRWQDASALEGEGAWKEEGYSVVFKRRLNLAGPLDVKLGEGTVVHAGVAIHDDNTVKRKHYVSFPFSIGVGAAADVRAVKLK